MVEEVCDPVDDARDLCEGAVDEGQDGAQAGEHLQAVVDADEAVVAGLGGQVELLHHIGAVSRHSGKVADAAFHEGAELRTVLLPTGAGLDAPAERELALCKKQYVTIQYR